MSPRLPPVLPGCPCQPLTHRGGTRRGGAVPCHPVGSAAGPRKPGCLSQGRGPAQHPARPLLPRVPVTQVGQGPPALTVRGRALPAAGWLDRQGLPGDTRHCRGVLHRYPAEGQLLARWRQRRHHLGTGSGWHQGTLTPMQLAPAGVSSAPLCPRSQRSGAVLCCVIPCHAWMCHAVPGHTVLCHAVLPVAMPCHAVPSSVIPYSCYSLPHQAAQCHAVAGCA